MPLQDLLQIGVVGAALSGLVQVLKAKLGTDSLKTKLLTVGLAVLVGGAYWLLRDTNLWKTILGVLASASTVYALLLKKPSQE